MRAIERHRLQEPSVFGHGREIVARKVVALQGTV